MSAIAEKLHVGYSRKNCMSAIAEKIACQPKKLHVGYSRKNCMSAEKIACRL